MDYYSLLGLKHGASKAEIKAAYRRLAMQWHPDKNPSPDAKQKFIQLTEAYDALMEGRAYSFRSFTSRKTTSAAPPKPKPKTDYEQRLERMAQQYEQLQLRFKKLRQSYRADPERRHEFYSKIYLNYALAIATLVVPLPVMILANMHLVLILFFFPFCIGFAARFYVTGLRKKERADMIFGDQEHYSFSELREFFGQDNFDVWGGPPGKYRSSGGW